MGRIKCLDSATINKIAAGEVVERPSSVVKELIENSIDAGATAISVTIKDGGISLIEVMDNGGGIPKEDAMLAFIRHATNKIESIEDLENTFSLGFRGEALASIAAVSQLTMVTKTKGAESGTLIEFHGGKQQRQIEIGCPDGTTITMKNLFYNVPARRKFLKRPGTESGYIADVIHKIALGHPEISFQYRNNGALLLHTSGNNDLRTAVFHIYGKETAQKLLPLSHQSGEIQISGLIGKPELCRANRSYENLFLNGRFIKSSLLSSAIEEAYKTRLMVGKFPVFVLNLSMPPDQVDVNVHPTKLEVRFANEDSLYQMFYQTVLTVLKQEVLIPKANWDAKPSAAVSALLEESPPVQEELDPLIVELPPEPMIEKGGAQKKPSVASLMQPPAKKQLNMVQEERRPYRCKALGKQVDLTVRPDMVFAEELEDEKKPEKKGSFFHQYKVVGQIFHTYWMIEQGESIYLIDQHAAHERILFEKFMDQWQRKSVVAQRLLEPVLFHLTEAEQDILEQHFSFLKNCGFEIENYGNATYALVAVPLLLKRPASAEDFIHMLDSLRDQSIENPYDETLHSIATMACKAAVKAHDPLDFMEAKAMIEQLLQLENPFSCPHGRPTIIEMTKYELEKKFKRIQ